MGERESKGPKSLVRGVSVCVCVCVRARARVHVSVSGCPYMRFASSFYSPGGVRIYTHTHTEREREREREMEGGGQVTPDPFQPLSGGPFHTSLT
jgi:hypothetical protein